MIRILIAVLGLMLLVIGTTETLAQHASQKKASRVQLTARERERSASSNEKERTARRQPIEALQIEMEKSRFEFVEKHQPKLAQMLRYLKKSDSDQYQKALAETARSQARLVSLSKRDGELYEVELGLWKTRGQLRLHAAEMAAKGELASKNLTEKLQRLVRKEVQLDLARLELIRDRAQKQARELTERIEKSKTSQDALVSKSLKTWQTRIKKQKAQQNKSK